MDIRAKLFCICPKCFKNLPKYFENGCFLDITGRKKYICPKYCIIEEIIYFYKAMGTDVTDERGVKVKKPEMILFDYGRTLLYQPGFSTSNGNKAIYPYINRNPRHISLEEYDETIVELFAKIKDERGPILEIHEHNFLKLAMEYMDISFSVSIEEAEEIIMNGISEGGIMPHADSLIDYLNERGIRTGVISNNCFSSNALKKLFDRLLPRNKFEFVMASSDYIFRKPHSMMFDIALQKAGLTADKVWYCGDSIEADVNGANNVGMFPVLYEGMTDDEPNPFAHQNDNLIIDFEHLHITDWNELMDVLERMGHDNERTMYDN